MPGAEKRPACALRRMHLLAVPLLLMMLLGCDERPPESENLVLADPEAGRELILRLGCGACHVIPGVPGVRGRVGPSLQAFAQRRYIAGTLPNAPPVLVEWVRNAPRLVPQTAMPALPIDETQARDIAAYLYTLR
jgi:mono/diheme cytochrome c family protein